MNLNKETIELNARERTALSILYGLRKKFVQERKNQKIYSSNELATIITELMNKMNRNEINIFHQEVSGKIINEEGVNTQVKQAIEKSTINRFDWKNKLGISLTELILKKRKDGLTQNQTLKEILNDKRIIKYIQENPRQANKMIKNLKISINARYIENKTAERIKNE